MGFASLQWAIATGSDPSSALHDFGTDLYCSGTTFVTLGLGDVVPDSGTTRALTVVECGTGFAFLALLIGYLPGRHRLSQNYCALRSSSTFPRWSWRAAPAAPSSHRVGSKRSE
jgi:hypothetical protein